MKSRLAGWLLWMLAVASGLAALVLGVMFVQFARLPFSEQGRHFEDGVVQHAQAAPIYGLLVLLLLATSLLAAWLARRLLRRGQNPGSQTHRNMLGGIERGEKAIEAHRVATQDEARERLGRWLK